MTVGDAFFLGILGTVGILSFLYFLGYTGLLLEWVIELGQKAFVRRVLFWACCTYLGTVMFVGVLLALIYLAHTGWGFLSWADDLRIYLLHSPLFSQYMYFFILLGIGIWCGVDAWLRSQGTVRARFGFAMGEGVEGLFIGGAVFGPILMVAYYFLYSFLHWLLDWGYMHLP